MGAKAINASVASPRDRAWTPIRWHRESILLAAGGAALLLAAILRVTLAVSLPLVEPTEARYAQIAAEMSANGDWLIPHVWIHGARTEFLGKPPLFVWTTAFCVSVFGPTEFAVRLPSLIATIALLSLMVWIIRRCLGAGTAWNAALITSTCLLVFGSSATVIYDMYLAFFVSTALLAQLALSTATDPAALRRWSLMVFLLLAGGFMTKGPVAIVLFGIPVVAWTALARSWRLIRRHHWTIGLLLFFAIVTPWFVLAEIRSSGFLRYFFVNENMLRYLVADYGDRYGAGHRFPYGTAVLFFVVGSLPWSLVAIRMVTKRGIKAVVADPGDRVTLFLFLGFATQIGFWIFARQLLGTYLLPAIPLFGVWLARMLNRSGWSPGRITAVAGSSALIWAVVLVAAAPIAAAHSARPALERAHDLSRGSGLGGSFEVAGPTPYSASFYLDDSVIHHPREPAATTLITALESPDRRLVILRRRDAEQMPSQIRHRLHPLTTDHRWYFVLTHSDRHPRRRR